MECYVSIVMLTYNQLALTKQCLASLESDTNVPYELILVDNNSTDGTKEFLRQYCQVSREKSKTVFIDNEKNLGFASGVNQGLRECTSEYICLLNNDTVLRRGWVDNLIHTLENYPNAQVVGPKSTGTFPPQYIETEAQLDGKIEEVSIMYGFCLVFRRELLKKIGALDERYKIGNFEDHDFNERVMRIGGKLVVDGRVYIEHKCHQSWDSKIHFDFASVKNMDRFIGKWGFAKKMEENFGEYEYYQYAKSMVVILTNDEAQNLEKLNRIEKASSDVDEWIVVDQYGYESNRIIIDRLYKKVRIIHVIVPIKEELKENILIEIGVNNTFAKEYEVMR